MQQKHRKIICILINFYGSVSTSEIEVMHLKKKHQHSGTAVGEKAGGRHTNWQWNKRKESQQT